MYVSARDRFILELLIEHSEGVTIREIATSLQVSERTIHRDLNSFDTLLHPYELDLEKKTGKGIFLKGAKEQIQQFSQDLQEAKHFDFLPERRQVVITCKLLESFQPMKLQSLATDLNVTVATISSDLDKVTEWLSRYNLSLEKRRGFGIQVNGSESAKRRAISGILAENFDESDILQYIRRQIPSHNENVNESIAGQLLGFINVDKLKRVKKSVEKISRSLDYRIADSAYIALVVHLTLAIERISQGENIKMNRALVHRLKEKKEYALATKLALELNKEFQLHIPEAEIGYITMHLRGAKLGQDSPVLFTDDNVNTAMIAKKLIQQVSKQVDVNLENDSSLYQGLIAHLEPALYRLKEGMHIHNPLQQKIQQNYPNLFLTVKNAFQAVITNFDAPDEEIGFLVLHFGSAIEREDNRRTHKAIVICSSGIGSSKMLASRLQNEFPNIIEVKNASLFELDDLPLLELDLVLSTIPLVDHDVDYVQVNPFLTEEDVHKIQDYIDRREHQDSINKAKNLSLTEKQATHARNQTKQKTGNIFATMQKSLACTIDLLSHFRLYINNNSSDLWGSLSQVVVKLKEAGLLRNEHPVIAKLKDRADLSGLGIPNTHLALFHARSEHVVKPSFVINQLVHPEKVDAMDGNTIEINRALIMLGPSEMTEEEVKILSAISSMIIENETSIAMFEQGSEEEISNYISDKFIRFYQEHLQKENHNE